jgi:hypothetical protein
MAISGNIQMSASEHPSLPWEGATPAADPDPPPGTSRRYSLRAAGRGSAAARSLRRFDFFIGCKNIGRAQRPRLVRGPSTRGPPLGAPQHLWQLGDVRRDVS